MESKKSTSVGGSDIDLGAWAGDMGGEWGGGLGWEQGLLGNWVGFKK